jgi:MFS family permease
MSKCPTRYSLRPGARAARMCALSVETRRVKGALLVVSSFTVMSGAIISPGLPGIRAFFADQPGIDLVIRLVLTMPALFIVIGAPIAGLVVDRWGRKPLLIVSLLLYALAGGSGLVFSSLPQILAGRAVLGLAVAGITTCVTALIADYYEGKERAAFMGIQAAAQGMGAILFLMIGGTLADIEWRLPFAIYLASLGAAPFAARWLFEPHRPDPQPSGGMTLASTNPIPWRLLILIYALILIMQSLFYLIPAQLPFYLKTLVGANAARSGFAISIATLFTSITSFLYGRVRARADFPHITAFSFGLVAGGFSVIGLAGEWAWVLVGLMIAGAGFGFLLPNLNVWLITVAPEALRGRALGWLTTFFFLGQFLSPILAQPLADRVGLARTYSVAGGFALALALLLGAWSWRSASLPEKRSES